MSKIDERTDAILKVIGAMAPKKWWMTSADHEKVLNEILIRMDLTIEELISIVDAMIEKEGIENLFKIIEKIKKA